MEKVKKREGFINKEVVLTCGVLIDTLRCGKARGSGANCHLRDSLLVPVPQRRGRDATWWGTR